MEFKEVVKKRFSCKKYSSRKPLAETVSYL